ncbi:MAG: sporulation integral membrane protein YtvI [Clostridia bacterium]|nr:sporulation integral membrane protein YtvI [Clostridia bacterium]
MDKTELRRKRIINFLYIAVILGLTYLFLKYCLGTVFPFIFAFFIAIIIQRPTNFIARKLKLKKKGAISIILVLLIYIFIAVLVSLLGVKIVSSVKDFVDFLTGILSDIPTLIDNIKNWLINIASILPAALRVRFTDWAEAFFGAIREKSAAEIANIITQEVTNGKGLSFSSFSGVFGGIWSTAKQIPSIVVATIISIISSFFMAIDYDRIVNFIKAQVKTKHSEKLSKAKKIVFTSMWKLIRSYGLIIIITWSELMLGLGILYLIGVYDANHMVGLTLLIAVADILPVIGTGLFVIPWALYSLITGEFGLGIGLLVIYAVIYVVRQILEPKIVGGTVGLPGFATIMAMYIGAQLFGALGVFLMPMLLIMIKLLNDEGVIHLWNTSKSGEPQTKPTDNA